MSGQIVADEQPRWQFSKDDNEVLVLIVKESQRNNCSGSHGQWKQYLANQVDKNSTKQPLTDPAKRPWLVLANFVNSLQQTKDVELVTRMIEWNSWQKKEDKAELSDPWPLTSQQELVVATREHTNFKLNYNFPSFGKEWLLVSRGPSPSSVSACNEKLLAIDCEMCLCENQVRQVVRLAVVDENCKVLVNTLVKPSLTVVDYKSDITGVTKKDLEEREKEGKVLSQTEAQAAVKELLTAGTILVGHGLYHDLKALKIDYRRVIDTSLIFSYNGLNSAIPALADLCKAVLHEGFRLDATHDSVEDSMAPMKLVLHELTKGRSPPLEPPSDQVDKSELAKLFIHKVPRGTKPADLEAIFPTEYKPHVQMITWKSMGTTFAVFKNPEIANKAFAALKGNQGKGNQPKDALGRAQKSVSLPNSSEVCVRKMGCHNGMLFGVDSRKGAVVAKEGEPKKKEKKKKSLPLVGVAGEDLIEGRIIPVLAGKSDVAEETNMVGGIVAEVAEIAVPKGVEKETVKRKQEEVMVGKGVGAENGSQLQKKLSKSQQRRMKKRMGEAARAGTGSVEQSNREDKKEEKAANGWNKGTLITSPDQQPREDCKIVEQAHQSARLLSHDDTSKEVEVRNFEVKPASRDSVDLKRKARDDGVEEEVSRLKRKLEEREAEVAALQKLVTALATRQSI